MLHLRHLVTLLALLLTTTNVHSDSLSGFRFIQVPAGNFIMGTANLDEAVTDMPEHDKELIRDETPAHLVVFPEPFLLSMTEVTQELWLDVMSTKPGPVEHWRHPQWKQLPVVSVSWHDTQAFIKKINSLSKSKRYRLPTEAEWEYAARAGSTKLRPFSLLEMDQFAWYLHSSNDEIQPVASRQVNAWGLHDMYGNVWEWVNDWYYPASYAEAESTNPQGPAQGTKKIRRGGSYHCPPHLIRPGYRSADLPTTAYSVIGFRLVAIEK